VEGAGVGVGTGESELDDGGDEVAAGSGASVGVVADRTGSRRAVPTEVELVGVASGSTVGTNDIVGLSSLGWTGAIHVIVGGVPARPADVVAKLVPAGRRGTASVVNPRDHTTRRRVPGTAIRVTSRNRR
jgi:hypothetical protein